MGNNIWVDDPFKGLVQARVNALADPEESVIPSEQAVLVEMLSPQYRREYLRRKGEAKRD